MTHRIVKRLLRPMLVLLAMGALSGCVVYPAYPGYGYGHPHGSYYGGGYGSGWRGSW